MKNFFSVALGLSILILALSGAYYLVVYIPSRDAAQMEAKQALQKQLDTKEAQKVLDQQTCSKNVANTGAPLTQFDTLFSICMKNKGY